MHKGSTIFNLSVTPIHIFLSVIPTFMLSSPYSHKHWYNFAAYNFNFAAYNFPCLETIKKLLRTKSKYLLDLKDPSHLSESPSTQTYF